MKSPKHLKSSIIATLSILSLGAISLPAKAYDICSDANIDPDIKAAQGCPSSASTTTLPDAVIIALNAVVAVAGLVAVIFIIIGGINYMTSAGDPNKVKKAKDTILYAVIGLVICVLAFAIVNFVITNALTPAIS